MGGSRGLSVGTPTFKNPKCKPSCRDLAVSDWTKQAFTIHPSVTASRKAEFLKNTLQKRAQLETEEVLLHMSMAPRVRKVLKGEKLLLLKHLLTEFGYDDLEVMDELMHGAVMTWVQLGPRQRGALRPSCNAQPLKRTRKPFAQWGTRRSKLDLVWSFSLS